MTSGWTSQNNLLHEHRYQCNVHCLLSDERNLSINSSYGCIGEIRRNPRSAGFVAAVVVGFSSYLLTMQVVYEFKKWRHSSQNNSYSRPFVLSTGSVVLLAWTNLVDIYGGEMPAAACDILTHLRVFLYSLTLNCIYFILWKRQRKFYVDARFGEKSSKITVFANFFVLICIWISNTSLPMIVTQRYQVTTTVTGCVITWSRNAKPMLIVIIVSFTIIGAVSQLSFLCLVVNPLVKGHCHQGSRSFLNVENDIKRLIVRLGIVTIVCIFFSTISPLHVYLHSSGLLCHFHLPNTLAIDLFINNVAILVTRTQWRKILWPCQDIFIRRYTTSQGDSNCDF